MSYYRRLYQQGGIYFFTLVTSGRQPILAEQNTLIRLKQAFRYTMKKHPYEIKGLVILPDHLHCIWQLPENDHDFSKRWNMIKWYFSIGLKSSINQRREKNIWQKRFWEHLIRDEQDLHRCLDYMHYNPVKHGYVNKPNDWSCSSFKRFVRSGYYDSNWGCDAEPGNIKELIME